MIHHTFFITGKNFSVTEPQNNWKGPLEIMYNLQQVFWKFLRIF